MSAKLQSLIVSYCSSLPDDVHRLEGALTPAAAGAEAILDNLAEALERVHRIKGAGGSLGFAAVSRAAAELEAHLRKFKAVTSARQEDIAPMLDSLAQLSQLAVNITPEGSSLYGIDLNRMMPPGRRAAGAC